ncbi:MAG: hypothetical protein PHQ12_11495 [Chthoniobacteraceae bacterium]|nr:hypothetical protein [Chthoniobacteraceae bacterium]
MPRKIKPPLLLFLALPWVVQANEKSAKPEPAPLSRYQAMIERTPFALATETAPAAAATESAGFTKDLVLTGAVRLGRGEYITVSSRDQSQRFTLRTGETYNGISIASIAWSDAVGRTIATLKRGSEYGVIRFDESAARLGPVSPVANRDSGGDSAGVGELVASPNSPNNTGRRRNIASPPPGS